MEVWRDYDLWVISSAGTSFQMCLQASSKLSDGHAQGP